MSAELRHIDFHGQQVPVLFREDEMFVPMRPRVEALGLDWSGQAAKFRSNPRKWSVEMISTVAADGCNREVLCLPLRKLDVWLLNLEPSRVKPEFREELEREQDELSQVLWAYRLTGAAIRPEVRAAAPAATQALFDEVEALTGLDPATAQPGTGSGLPPGDWISAKDAAKAMGITADAFRLSYCNPVRPRVVCWERRGPKGGRRLLVERGSLNRLISKGLIEEGETPKREDSPIPLTPGMVRELRQVYGAEQMQNVLHRLSPGIFPAPEVLR